MSATKSKRSALGVIMVVVGALLGVFALLAAVGYFMVEEEDPAWLVISTFVLVGGASGFMSAGIYLLRTTRTP